MQISQYFALPSCPEELSPCQNLLPRLDLLSLNIKIDKSDFTSVCSKSLKIMYYVTGFSLLFGGGFAAVLIPSIMC